MAKLTAKIEGGDVAQILQKQKDEGESELSMTLTFVEQSVKPGLTFLYKLNDITYVLK